MKRVQLRFLAFSMFLAVVGLYVFAQSTGTTGAGFTDQSTGASAQVQGATWVQTLSPNQDSWVNETLLNQGTNYGTASTMSVGGLLTLLETRSFLQFDLSSIPSGATIRSAQLRVCDPGLISAAVGHDLQVVDAAWDESTITWNNQPAATGLTGLEIVITLGPTCFFTDVQTHVQAWVDGTVPNHGWRISSDVLAVLLQYATKEHANPALHPQLVIDHVP